MIGRPVAPVGATRRSRPAAAAAVLALLALLAGRVALAQPALAAVVAGDDARKAIVIGAGGEVYEPDGHGAWIHRLPCATAGVLTAAGRAGGAVVATGDGVIYRLAGNGWSAVRLVQHGKAVLGAGPRALAAVGRQLYALDSLTRGEPTRLAVAPGNVVALAASDRAIVVATDAGVFRLDRKPTAIKLAPRSRLISERWAISGAGAVELPTGKQVAWPAGLTPGPATTVDDALVAVASGRAGLELVTVRAGTVTRSALGLSGTAVAVAADRAGRAVVVLGDGRLAVREPARDPAWTVATPTDAPAADHPGAPPATQAP